MSVRTSLPSHYPLPESLTRLDDERRSGLALPLDHAVAFQLMLGPILPSCTYDLRATP